MTARLRISLFAALAAAVAVAAADAPVPAGDYPGWRGAARDGVSTEKGIITKWPEGGPKLAFKVKGLGDGYSTPAIAGGKVYLMGLRGSDEVVIALNAADGKELWSSKVGGNGTRSYPGARCTPTVDGDRLYAMSSDGKVACLERADGKKVWSKDLVTEYQGKRGNWAYTESPLVDGDKVVVTPGGDEGTIVCLDKATGKQAWKAAVAGLKSSAKAKGGFGGKGGKGGPKPYSQAGYSSAVAAEIAGERQYVQFLSGGVVGVSAKDGKLLWHYDAPASGSANCSTPIVFGDMVFAASSYGVGGGAAKITKTAAGFKAEPVYFVSAFTNHHGGAVKVGDYIYGTNNSGLMCIEAKSGKEMWKKARGGAGKGSVMAIDGHLIHRGEDGTVALVEANPREYVEKGIFRQPERASQKAWAYPAVAGGRLYLRDWDKLFVYELK